MTARILAPVSAEVFEKPSWVKRGVVSHAIDDAIKAGPSVAIPLRVAGEEDLKPLQHACHVYAVRKGYRIETKTEKRRLTLYVRVVRPIEGLFHRAGRPLKSSSLAMRALRNEIERGKR